MSNNPIRDIGSEITARRAAANTAATAGGAGDNTSVTGVIIDRAAIGFPASMVVAIPYTATLGAGDTLSIGYTVQTSEASDMSGAVTVATAALAPVATGGAGGSTETGTFEVSLNLTGARRYIRVNFTPDLSRANTDTAALSAVAVFAGANRLPQ